MSFGHERLAIPSARTYRVRRDGIDPDADSDSDPETTEAEQAVAADAGHAAVRKAAGRALRPARLSAGVSWTDMDDFSQVDIEAVINEQLPQCTPEQRALFARYRVPPYRAPIEIHGRVEWFFIVATRDGEAMYYEDIEEGFNFSPLDADGRIAQHWCNQDELKYALRRWSERIDS